MMRALGTAERHSSNVERGGVGGHREVGEGRLDLLDAIGEDRDGSVAGGAEHGLEEADAPAVSHWRLA